MALLFILVGTHKTTHNYTNIGEISLCFICLGKKYLLINQILYVFKILYQLGKHCFCVWFSFFV